MTASVSPLILIGGAVVWMLALGFAVGLAMAAAAGDSLLEDEDWS